MATEYLLDEDMRGLLQQADDLLGQVALRIATSQRERSDGDRAVANAIRHQIRVAQAATMYAMDTRCVARPVGPSRPTEAGR